MACLSLYGKQIATEVRNKKKKKKVPGLLTNSLTTGLIFSSWKNDLDDEESFTCLL